MRWSADHFGGLNPALRQAMIVNQFTNFTPQDISSGGIFDYPEKKPSALFEAPCRLPDEDSVTPRTQYCHRLLIARDCEFPHLLDFDRSISDGLLSIPPSHRLSNKQQRLLVIYFPISRRTLIVCRPFGPCIRGLLRSPP